MERRLPRSRRRHQTGQSLVEFALVVPFFLALLFSIIEFGRATYYVQMLNNAAREGARYAIVHGAESTNPSGPFPPAWAPDQNPGDLYGANVVAATKNAAIAVIDSASPTDFVVSVKWCDEDGNIADCPDTNAAGRGDGDNGRNQTVMVSVTYEFEPWIRAIVPLPTFTLTGASSLVVNH